MKKWILVFSWIPMFLAAPLGASSFPIVGETSTCEIQISLVKDFNDNPVEVGKAFQRVFGGTNSIRVLEKFESGYTAEIKNKNGALDLRVIVEYNYATNQFEFVGGGFIGFARGILSNCR